LRLSTEQEPSNTSSEGSLLNCTVSIACSVRPNSTSPKCEGQSAPLNILKRNRLRHQIFAQCLISSSSMRTLCPPWNAPLASAEHAQRSAVVRLATLLQMSLQIVGKALALSPADRNWLLGNVRSKRIRLADKCGCMMWRLEVDKAEGGVALDSHGFLLGRDVDKVVSASKATFIQSLDQDINGCQFERNGAEHQCSIAWLQRRRLLQRLRR